MDVLNHLERDGLVGSSSPTFRLPDVVFPPDLALSTPLHSSRRASRPSATRRDVRWIRYDATSSRGDHCGGT